MNRMLAGNVGYCQQSGCDSSIEPAVALAKGAELFGEQI